MSVLAQDQAQANQAINVIQQKQYDQDKAAYEKDKKRYEKELETYNKNVAAQKKANEKARIQAEKDRVAAIKKQKTQETAAFWKQSHVVLDRTTADIMAGKRSNTRGLNINQQLILKKARARQAVSEGRMTAAQGLAAIGQASNVFFQQAHARTIAFAKATSAESLAKEGNAEIKEAQAVELQRLGSSGSTQSGNTGPTKISQTLVKDTPSVADRVEVAPDTADKAQPWKSGFTVDTRMFGYSTTGQAEIDRQNAIKTYEAQQRIDAQGLSHNIEQLNKLGLSTIYNQGEFGYLKPIQPNTKPTAPTKDPKMAKFHERASKVLNANQQAKKAQAAFTEVYKPQKMGAVGANWITNDKGFFTKAAATKYAQENTPVKVTMTDGTVKTFKNESNANTFINLTKLGTPALMLLGGVYTNQLLYPSLKSETKYSVAYGKDDKKTATFDSKENAERFSARVNPPVWTIEGVDKKFKSEIAANQYIEK